MATPPIFRQHVQTAFNGQPATQAITFTLAQAGDVLSVACVTEDSGLSFTAPTNDGAALAWALKQDADGASNTRVDVWTATLDTTRTIIVTGHGATTKEWGVIGRAWGGSDGVGATNKVEGDTTANFSVNLTTTQANSAIDVYWADWAATAGARTYLTGAGAYTEKTNFNDGQYSTGSGYHADAGAINTYTIGNSAPAGQDVTFVVVEILGAGVAADDSLRGGSAGEFDPHLQGSAWL